MSRGSARTRRVITATLMLLGGFVGAWGCAERAVYQPPPLPSMTVRDFVYQRVMGDQAFKAIAAGADKAQEAYNLVADTPIDEIEEGSEKYKQVQ